MPTAASVTEGMSPDGAIRVRVGKGGRTLWVGLSPPAMRLSAAELASDIVSVNTLALLMFQVSEGLRTQDELAVYARFVATRCCAGLHQRPDGVVSEILGGWQPPEENHDELVRRIQARLKSFEALLAVSPVNVEWIGSERDVVVTADPDRRLAALWLSPRCTTHYSAIELESLLNRVLAAVAATPPGRNSLRDAG